MAKTLTELQGDVLLAQQALDKARRIAVAPTVANAATDAALAPVVVQPPGAGGWTPPSWLGAVLALVVGVGGSVASVMASGPVTVPVVIGAVLAGLTAAASTFLGVKSAGPRKDI